MSRENRYSSGDVARILQAEGFNNISKRTINYYAFDKKMFAIKEAGKNSFTDEEVDKIRAIKLLQEFTNFTLEQIKTIINRYSLNQVKDLCQARLLRPDHGRENYYNNYYGFNDNNNCEGNQNKIHNIGRKNSHCTEICHQEITKDGACSDEIPQPVFSQPLVEGGHYLSEKAADYKSLAVDNLKIRIRKEIAISGDIALVVSGKVDDEKICMIVNFIKKIEE